MKLGHLSMVPLTRGHLPYKVTLGWLKGWPYKKLTTCIQFTKFIFKHSTGMDIRSNSQELIVNSSKSYKHAHTRARAHTHTHKHTYIHTHAHTQARTHARTLAHTHTHILRHAHTHTCAHARSRTHAHTYTVDCKRWEDIVKVGKGWPPNLQPISGRRRCDFPVLK